MRDIKFRGKIKSDNPVTGKRWAYGYYCQVESKHYIILDDAGIGVPLGTGTVCIEGFVEVYPETVGRFTGFLDKNCKEIYEGDIISVPRYKYNTHLIIKWNEEDDGFAGNHIEAGDEEYFDKFRDCIIAGNITDNPELLET